jgi:sugar O-acyltransferase (sialic acid O-acetyltransferase NeuD family)
MEKFYLYGASGHGKVVCEILSASGIDVEAFIDDNQAISECLGRPVVHDYQNLSKIIVSVGSNKIRRNIVKKISACENGKEPAFATAIHPSAVVSPSAKIGEGTVVMAGAIINADAVIGKHCIINTGASVDHDCVLGDYSHIAPHATLCGNVHVGEGTIVGVGACVVPSVLIGDWVTIGAGAAVICDINDGATAIGVPAKSL